MIPRQASPTRTNQGLNVALSSERRSFRESFKTDPTFNKNRANTHTHVRCTLAVAHAVAGLPAVIMS